MSPTTRATNITTNTRILFQKWLDLIDDTKENISGILIFVKIGGFCGTIICSL
jgi:hypothetical protein